MVDLKKWKDISDKLCSKIGNGKTGLTEFQKNERIKLRLGIEANKIRKFSETGVKLLEGGIKRRFIIPEGNKGPVDIIPKGVIDNLDKYPSDSKDPSGKSKILSIEVKGDGGMEISGIIKNGKEKNIIGRTIYSVVHLPDELAVRSVRKNFKNGDLKEIEPRIIPLLSEGELEEMLSNSNIELLTTERVSEVKI